MTASAQPTKEAPAEETIKPKKDLPPEEADTLLTQLISKDPTITGVINLWKVNLVEGLNILSIKESSPDRYLNLVEHRDQSFGHALNQVTSVDALSNELTQGAKKDLNSIKNASQEEFKAIMTLAKARKEKLLTSKGV